MTQISSSRSSSPLHGLDLPYLLSPRAGEHDGTELAAGKLGTTRITVRSVCPGCVCLIPLVCVSHWKRCQKPRHELPSLGGKGEGGRKRQESPVYDCMAHEEQLLVKECGQGCQTQLELKARFSLFLLWTELSLLNMDNSQAAETLAGMRGKSTSVRAGTDRRGRKRWRMGHSGGRSGEENSGAQNRAKESNTGKQRRVACGCQQHHGSGGKMRRRSGKKQGGNRSGRVMQACCHPLSMAVNPAVVAG